MKRTRNGILIPDVPIMAGGNLPNAVKGVSAGNEGWKKHAVDMGLPSGTLWADCDIDVNMVDGFCVTPFIYEKSFFSWGNVQGYNPIANSFNGIYDWSDENYSLTGGSLLMTDIPATKEYDVAIANLGKSWRLPSIDEFRELITNCYFINEEGEQVSSWRVNVNGINGLYLESRTNGNRIFFACSGYGDGVNLINKQLILAYWTRNVNDSSLGSCFFGSNNGLVYQGFGRKGGLTIRAVLNA